MEMRADLFNHIAVVVPDINSHRSGSVFLVKKLSYVAHGVFLFFELVKVVVAQNIIHLKTGDITLYLVEVVEALSALGMLGALIAWQRVVELYTDVHGVYHPVLSVSRMNGEALNGNGCSGGVKVFVFYLTGVTSVNGEGKVGAEALDIKFVGAAPNLLVGRKAYTDFSVRDILA